MNQEKKLTQDEAQGLGRRFLLSRYPDAKITFNKAVLSTEGDASLYYLEGNIQMPSRSLVSSLLFRSPDQYTFKMQVSALKGEVLSWELK